MLLVLTSTGFYYYTNIKNHTSLYSAARENVCLFHSTDAFPSIFQNFYVQFHFTVGRTTPVA